MLVTEEAQVSVDNGRDHVQLEQVVGHPLDGFPTQEGDACRRRVRLQVYLHDGDSIVVEDGRHVFRRELVGGIADEETCLPNSTIAYDDTPKVLEKSKGQQPALDLGECTSISSWVLTSSGLF